MIDFWITFDRIISVEDMTHQHASNIYYFVNYIMSHAYPQSLKDEVNEIINTRFNGVILPYRPHPDFVGEKNLLKKLGYLKENNQIYIDNKWVGELIETQE